MSKFFVNKDQVFNDEIYIIGNDVNHIKNVLRYKINNQIQISTTDENKLPITYLCSITEINSENIVCKINNIIHNKIETNTYIHLFQGMPKFDKMELILQKNTELGVKEFTPIIMKRTIIKINEKDSINKLNRWKKIVEVASKQSGREIIPIVNNIINFKNMYSLLTNYDIVLVPYENEKNNCLKDELKKISNIQYAKIAVIIGPEGGFEQEEIETLQNLGAKIVTLGERILRTETASIAINSNIIYELES